jgi:hypothetical protein
LIPFLKIPVSVADAEEFADESLQAFGLSDAPGLRHLAHKLKTSTSGRADIPIDLLATLTSLTSSEFITHVGTNATSEVIHFKPIIGQLASASTGYVMMRKRLLSIIEKSRTVAGQIHEGILIPVVVHNNLSVDPSCQPISMFPVLTESLSSIPSFPSTRMTTIASPPTITPTLKATSTSIQLIRTLARIAFQACVSLFALFTLTLSFIIITEDDPSRYVLVPVTGLITGVLTLKVRTFRVMLLTNLLGKAFVGFCYVFGFGEVEKNESLALLLSMGAGMYVLTIST